MSAQLSQEFPDGYAIAHVGENLSPESEAAIRAVMQAAYDLLEEPQMPTLLHTGEDLSKLHDALTLVANSQWVGDECEDANYHSLTEFLLELRDSLHVCDFKPTGDEYDGEIEYACTVPGCYTVKYV